MIDIYEERNKRPFIVKNDKFGNFIIYGLNVYRNELDGGQFSMLLYENKAIKFIDYDVGIQLIDADSCFFQEVNFYSRKLGIETYIMGEPGHYYLFKNNKLKSIDNVFIFFNAGFSSPAIIDKNIYYWGFDKFENIYAICYDINKNQFKKLRLNLIIEGTDYRFAYERPYKEGNIIHYKTSNYHFKLSDDLKLLE